MCVRPCREQVEHTPFRVRFCFVFIFLYVVLEECSWLTYMAVEQAAFVTCNSFRLVEVFNRHFKLKKEEACKK